MERIKPAAVTPNSTSLHSFFVSFFNVFLKKVGQDITELNRVNIRLNQVDRNMTPNEYYSTAPCCENVKTDVIFIQSHQRAHHGQTLEELISMAQPKKNTSGQKKHTYLTHG